MTCLPKVQTNSINQPFLSKTQPRTANPVNTPNAGACGNPEGPNSGSIPSVPGYRIDAKPASQYIVPTNTAVRNESLLHCLTSAGGADRGSKDGRHV